MAEVVANSEVAVCAKRILRRRLRTAAALALAAMAIFPAARVAAQTKPKPQFAEPPPPAEIFFVPATLNPVSGFNPANGHLNGAGYGGDGMLANSSSSQFSYPVGMAYDTNGNLFIADESNYIVRRIDAVTGDLSTFAGTPRTFGFSPSTGSATATSAKLGLLAGLVVDSSNNVYVSDRSNNVVWKITSGGAISIFAGAGAGNCGVQTDGLGDGCAATAATLNNPWALGIDASNNIYIADSYNDLVRVVSSSTGKISIFAGDVADAGSYGDCNSASQYTVAAPGPYLPTQTHLCFPDGIAFDGLGNAYISNAASDTVQIVNSSGFISNFAGSYGVRSYSGDGGPAVDALLNEPAGLFVDPANRVYISDFFNGEVRVVDSSGNINDVMGTTHGGLNNSSIGEPDTEAIINSSTGQFSGAADGIYSILMDPYGNILADDSSADAITSAGTTGQYYFGNNNQIYQTATTTSLNAFSAFYPPYILISNPGNTTLNFTGTPTVTTITPSATPPAFALDGGTCTFPGSLAPGASCTVVVSFTPTEGGTGAGTPYTGTIVIDSNSNSSPNTILLSGNGIGTCQNSATLTSTLSFSSPPNVTTATQTATLTNNGNCPYSTASFSPAIVNPNPSASMPFTVVSNNCPATLNQNASCSFNIDFTPTAVVGYSAQLQVSIPNYGNVHTFLSGSGITAPAVSFNPMSLPFASTMDGSTTSPMSTVMTNIGNAPLNNIVVSLAGSNPSYFAFSGTNNCGASLAAGAFCTISVDFSPQAALTSYAAAISVADSASGSPQTVALSGTGFAPLPPAVINDTEIIHTTDTPAVTGATLVVDTETIHTIDIPVLNESALVLDSEVVHTTDTPAIAPSALVLDSEIVHTTDTPALIPTMLVLDAETIHTTDTPALTQSLLILDAEIIHTTDTPSEKILTSPTTTVLTASSAAPAAGNPVTFTATVSSTAGTPAGNVTFYDGATPLGTVTLTGGVAAYATSSLSDGTHSISAVYLGSSLFLTSTSNTLTEMVNDFTLSFLGTGGAGVTLTILPGTSGTYTIVLTPPAGGYSGTITLSASGLPAGATASFSPNPVTLSGTAAADSVLTITVPAPMALAQPAPTGPNPGPNSGPAGNRTFLLLGALLPLLGLGRGIKRNSLRLLALALFSICVCIGISSCGGNFFTQPSETYVVTVTATSGTDQHSATVDLIVP